MTIIEGVPGRLVDVDSHVIVGTSGLGKRVLRTMDLERAGEHQHHKGHCTHIGCRLADNQSVPRKEKKERERENNVDDVMSSMFCDQQPLLNLSGPAYGPFSRTRVRFHVSITTHLARYTQKVQSPRNSRDSRRRVNIVSRPHSCHSPSLVRGFAVISLPLDFLFVSHYRTFCVIL